MELKLTKAQVEEAVTWYIKAMFEAEIEITRLSIDTYGSHMATAEIELKIKEENVENDGDNEQF